MAVIEIQAATLPGFPYYFPYRTGVRLSNAATVDGSKVYYGDTSVVITAEATVTSDRTATVDAELTTSASTSGETFTNHAVSASLTILAASVLDFARDTTVASSETITATGSAIAYRNQGLDGTVDISAVLDNLANIEAFSDLIGLEVMTGITAEAQIVAVSDSSLALFATITDSDSQLDAVGSSDTTGTATGTAEIVRDQPLAGEPTEIAATITAEINQATENSAELAISAGITAEAQRTQYGETELAVTADPSAKVTNADAALSVTAEPSASLDRAITAEAELAVTATTLIDTEDTRYGDTSQTVTGTTSAASQLSASGSATTEITNASTADSTRTTFGSSTTAVSAVTTGAISQVQRLASSTAITAGLTADSQVTRYGDASLTVSATRTAAVTRVATVAAETTVTASGTGSLFRQTFATAELPVTAEISQVLNLSAPIESLLLSLTAVVDISQRSDLISSGDLALLSQSFPTNNAFFVVGSLLRAFADPDAKGGQLLLVEASLETTATIDLVSMQRQVWAAAQELQIQASILISQMVFILTMNAELTVLATNPAEMLYRHSGGNPMWLMFFYAGYGDRTL